MTGLRTYTSLDPNQWRFPRWKSNVYYPSGSFVAVTEYNAIDSELPLWSYWVATKDVSSITDSDNNTSNPPNDSDGIWAALGNPNYPTNPWALAFDTSAQTLNADIIAKVAALTPLLALIGVDSDINALYTADSDFRIHDSEQDSDIRMEIHDRFAADSDIRHDLDSDIAHVRHDYLAADSEIYRLIYDHDSENRKMHDSDRHDWRAVDSDLRVRDSELDSDIQMEVHDRKAADSDVRLDIDSDVLVLHIRSDSDSDRLTNFIASIAERDSDFLVKFTEIDSDIRNIRIDASQLNNQTGFPVGAIQAFASTTMPIGFRLCDGSTYNTTTYPDLFAILGTNQLPDLRNQFLRGWNNDSDGFGNVRAILSQQGDTVGPHQHTSDAFTTGGGVQPYDGAGSATLSPATIDPLTNDETRPTNVSVAYGIAMYQGAGIIYDSEVIESIVRIKFADHDSDLNALYNRTDYYSATLTPDSENFPAGYTYDTGVNANVFEDIEVRLNGVAVSQWTVAGSVFTFNFLARAKQDVIVIKMRR